MRIALFHNLPSGGAKRAVYEWTHRLAKNHSIDVYTLSAAHHEFADVRWHVSTYDVTAFTPRALYASPLGRLNQLQRYLDLVDLTALSRRMAEKIDNGSYDIVFVHNSQFTTIPTILRFLQTPSLYYLHEPFGRNFSRDLSRSYLHKTTFQARLDKHDPLIKLYQRKLETVQHQSLVNTTMFLANSKYTQRCMEEMFGMHCPVCHLGVDLEIFRALANVTSESFVVSVGEMSPRKGFDFLVESIGRMPRHKRPPLKLACNRVEPLELEYVTCLAKQYEVDLEVRSGLSPTELGVLYNQARLCLYAPVKEPFGLVPLEAMACETPVVGVNEGGVRESVIHEFNGLLVERDPDQFASAVQQLLQSPQLAREYGINGRRHVQQNWTWDRSTALIERHLESCAKIGSSRDSVVRDL